MLIEFKVLKEYISIIISVTKESLFGSQRILLMAA